MQATPGTPLPPGLLCQRSDPANIPFDTTADLEKLSEIPGQERALEAIHFAVGLKVDGHNVFVLGEPGSGRHEFVRHFLEKTAAERDVPRDWCYVYNFEDARRPRALSLPAGLSWAFRDDVERVVTDAMSGIPAAFESEEFHAQREAIAEDFKETQEAAFKEVESDAKEQDVGVLQTPTGIAFVPVREGEALSPEEFKKLSEKEQEKFHDEIGRLTKRLQVVLRSMPKKASEMRQKLRELEREVAGLAVAGLFDELVEKYGGNPGVAEHLQRMQQDVVENVALFLPRPPGGAAMEAGQPAGQGETEAARRYAVNILVSHEDKEGAPVVFVGKPPVVALGGRLEHETDFG